MRELRARSTLPTGIDRLLVATALIATLAGLAGCGGASRVPQHRLVDWYELDRDLDPEVIPARQGWLGHAATMNEDWAGPAARFLPTIAFDAAWDSLGSEAFAGRPAGERAWRRETAADLVQQAFLAVADRAYQMRRGIVGDENHARVLGRVLRRLHTAVGTDPESADSWFHLAVFSNVVGDRDSASRARHRYLDLTDGAAPASVAETAMLNRRRCRLILDEAWDLRDAGRFESCFAWIADNLRALRSGTAGSTALPPITEANLLRALCHAERGEFVQARSYLTHLPRISLQTRSIDPRAPNLSLAPDELRLWVHAWLDLRTGAPDMAAWRIGTRLDGLRSIDIIWRFWQDMGQIAAELGDEARARENWVLAYWDRPYKRLFPQTAHRAAGQRRPEPGSGLPYFQSYRTFFLGGSRWAYAVNRALASQQADRSRQPLLWRQAMSSLDACIRRQFQPRAAHVLRARLHLLEGAWDLARADLEAAARDDLGGDFDEASHAYLQGVVTLGAGQLPESQVWFERCLALEPDHPEALQALAANLAYRGQDEQALLLLDRAEELQPPGGRFFYNRGLLHLQRGERELAVADLRRAAALLPGQEQVATLLQAAVTGREVAIDLTPQPQLLVTGAHARAATEFDQELLMVEPGDRRQGEVAAALQADRELGDPALALAVAAGEIPDADLDATALLLATAILLETGHDEAARAVLERARALAPDNETLRALRERSPR